MAALSTRVLGANLVGRNDPESSDAEGAASSTGSGFLDPMKEYPIATRLLTDNKDSILEELQGLLQDKSGDGRRWGVWAAKDYEPPKFTLLTPEQILERQQTVVQDPDSRAQWSLYGIYLFGKVIERGRRSCPKTYAVLGQISGIVNAGFSCLGPESETGWHDDVDKGFDRLHLPLIVPKGEVCFKVGSETRTWQPGHVLAFDDTFRHNAWNATNKPRYVLIVDILRSDNRAAEIAARGHAISTTEPEHTASNMQQPQENCANNYESQHTVEQETEQIDQIDLLDEPFYDDWEVVLPALKYVMANVDVLRRDWNKILGLGRKLGVQETSHTSSQYDAKQCGNELSLLIDSPELTYNPLKHTWKNYWLCHSFPAYSDEFTTWIPGNCERMPDTTALLRGIPGIRDAFFSRLGPGVVLDEHNGYADQSNYVLRCHIPLVVPDDVPVADNEGITQRPCYIDCAGERRYHTLGEPIVFDDSKLHSAGNLSPDQARAVLILDFARPKIVRMGSSRARISRAMMSGWCKQVYPGISDDDVEQIVDARATSCSHFDEENEY